jgi:hypothetical protein
MAPEPVNLCPKDLRKKLKEGELVQLVKSVNRGNRQATTIGLFPHALRKRVEQAGFETDDLSRAIIRLCAKRFQEYLRLSRTAESYRQGMDKLNPYRCRDPFHYLDVARNKKNNPRATCMCEDIIITGKKRRRKMRKESTLTRSKQPRAERKEPHLGLGTGQEIGSNGGRKGKKKGKRNECKSKVGKKPQETNVKIQTHQLQPDVRFHDGLDHKHKPPDIGAPVVPKGTKKQDIRDYFKPRRS